MQETLQRLTERISVVRGIRQLRQQKSFDVQARKLIGEETARIGVNNVVDSFVRELQSFGDRTARRLPSGLFVAIDGKTFIREGVVAEETEDGAAKAVFFTISGGKIDVSFYFRVGDEGEPREVSFADYAKSPGEIGLFYQDFYGRALSTFEVDYQAAIAIGDALPMPIPVLLQFPSVNRQG